MQELVRAVGGACNAGCGDEEPPWPRRIGETMRNRQLHRALHDFASEAAWQLSSDVDAGEELSFEIVAADARTGFRSRDTPLYCYRPLTADFIDRRHGVIARLPSYLPAVHALQATGGLEDYLHVHVARGASVRDPRERAELALRAFLGSIFCDSTEFVLDDARFERAYADLESVVHEGQAETIVVAPVLGLRIDAPEIAMTEGLVLVRGDVLEDAPDEALFDGDGQPLTLAVVRWQSPPGDEAPFDHAQARLARLMTALRLYDPAAPTLAPAAWMRTSGGPWAAVALGGQGGLPAGEVTVAVDAEDELRAFCSLVGRRTPRKGEVAWALRRFELGCARDRLAEALTDHLLALRALLEPEGPGSGRLPGRLAALCAEPEERAYVTERVARAVSLERALVTGVGMGDADDAADCCLLIAESARMILRDVLCGHLDADLRSVADRLIAEPATA